MIQPRFERKYLLPKSAVDAAEVYINQHPAVFKEIFHRRVINNLYFDDRQLHSYYQNLNGEANRYKVRLRWYSQRLPHQIFSNKTVLTSCRSSGSFSDPHFELKLRQGETILKHLFTLNQGKERLKIQLPKSLQFLLSDGLVETQQSQTKAAHDPHSTQLDVNLVYEKIHLLKPIIVNSYQRRYFLSADKKVRLTLDTDLKFYSLFNHHINWDHFYHTDSTVIELKADVAAHQSLSEVARYFPFQLNRFSKYVLGVSGCLPNIEPPLYSVKIQPSFT